MPWAASVALCCQGAEASMPVAETKTPLLGWAWEGRQARGERPQRDLCSGEPGYLSGVGGMGGMFLCVTGASLQCAQPLVPAQKHDGKKHVEGRKGSNQMTACWSLKGEPLPGTQHSSRPSLLQGIEQGPLQGLRGNTPGFSTPCVGSKTVQVPIGFSPK
jgi:hypothetical protein